LRGKKADILFLSGRLEVRPGGPFKEGGEEEKAQRTSRGEKNQRYGGKKERRGGERGEIFLYSWRGGEVIF